MIETVLVGGIRPDYYECKVGDLIKIHTPNFGNVDYVREFKQYRVDEVYIVEEAVGNAFAIGHPSIKLRNTTFGQRSGVGNSTNKFGDTFELVFTDKTSKLHIKGDDG